MAGNNDKEIHMSEETRKPFDISNLKNDMKLARLAQEKPVTKWQAEDSAQGKEISQGTETAHSA